MKILNGPPVDAWSALLLEDLVPPSSKYDSMIVSCDNLYLYITNTHTHTDTQIIV